MSLTPDAANPGRTFEEALERARSSDPASRWGAAKALGGLGASLAQGEVGRAVACLAALARDAEVSVRLRSLASLNNLAPVLDPGQQAAVLNLATAVFEAGNGDEKARALRMMTRLLRAGAAVTGREDALLILFRVRASPLAFQLSHTSASMAEDALAAQEGASREALARKLLLDPHLLAPGQLLTTLEALAALAPAVAFQPGGPVSIALLRASRNGEASVRIEAAEALVALARAASPPAPAWAKEAILAELRDTDLAVRRGAVAAALALVAATREEGLGALLEAARPAMFDPAPPERERPGIHRAPGDPPVEHPAVALVGGCIDRVPSSQRPLLAETLLAAAGLDDPGVRWHATSALAAAAAKADPPLALRIKSRLEVLAADPDARVASAAKSGWSKLDRDAEEARRRARRQARKAARGAPPPR